MLSAGHCFQQIQMCGTFGRAMIIAVIFADSCALLSRAELVDCNAASFVESVMSMYNVFYNAKFEDHVKLLLGVLHKELRSFNAASTISSFLLESSLNLKC